MLLVLLPSGDRVNCRRRLLRLSLDFFLALPPPQFPPLTAGGYLTPKCCVGHSAGRGVEAAGEGIGASR